MLNRRCDGCRSILDLLPISFRRIAQPDDHGRFCWNCVSPSLVLIYSLDLGTVQFHNTREILWGP